MEDDPFSLPLFNHHPTGGLGGGTSALPAIRTNADLPPSQIPPPPPASAHRNNASTQYTQGGVLSSPFSASPRVPTTGGPPIPNSHRPHASSVSSAAPYPSGGFGQSYPQQQQELMPPPPTSSSSSSYLGRSTSLGGTRKKDPFAYRSDDVESGFGNMDVSDNTIPPMPSSATSGHWSNYQNNNTATAQRQSYHGYPTQPSSQRDVIMSPNKQHNNPMNPPPVPAHAMRQAQQQSSIPQNEGHSSSTTFQANNPYIPRGSDPGPSSTGASGADQSQWTDYRRPSINQRMSSTGSYQSRNSDQLSPFTKPVSLSVGGELSPSSPLMNPYDMSSSSATTGFPSSSPSIPPPHSNIPNSPRWNNPTTTASSSNRPVASPVGGRPPPSTRGSTSTANQLYPSSQPVTPAGKYELAPSRAENTSREATQSRFGFREVHDYADLKPVVNTQPNGRRADPDASGKYLSPLKCLTAALPQTYNLCNPNFRYETSDNPRRVLTKPSKPAHNDGADNEDWDYILYVNDVLGGEHGGDRYLILDVLGQGTFGQVVKCQNMRTHEIVAVKVVKNKPAYLQQSKMEVAILELLNGQHDPNDRHHILRMHDNFTHKSHLCLVFECLSSNLYELIKQNQFKGLSTQLVKVFTGQMLDCLTVLKDARLIHCDLKPENILLKSLQSPQIKIIDFGSACHEMQTVYTYIQSRFYRSPEVLLGLPYSAAIDMWSLGCIVVELFLGLPLFPGTSEYNQLSRIVDMLGTPPNHLLEVGKQTHEFFNTSTDPYGRKTYKLKPMHQYASEHRTDEQPSKQYFKQTKLKDIIMEYSFSKRGAKQSDIDKEMAMRRAFVDFAEGLLNMDPIKRWSPQQAAKHPFITGEKFTGPFQPTAHSSKRPSHAPTAEIPSSSPSSSKKYGGLVQSPTANRTQRVYSDAASYNQQLAQHQSFTAQVQNAANVPKPGPFSPGYDMQQSQQVYAQGHRIPSQSQQMPQAQQGQRQPSGQWQQVPSTQVYQQQRVPSLNTSSSHAQLRQPSNNAAPMVSSSTTNPPPNSYYPATRNRANTINQIDAIPPALARLVQYGAQDPSGTRNSLTPVLMRDDYEQYNNLHSGGGGGHQHKASGLAHQSYPQLEYLQEQAELASNQWLLPTNSQNPYGNTSHGGHSGRHRNHLSLSGNQNYQMQPPIGIGISPPTNEYTSSSNINGRREYDFAHSHQSRASYGGHTTGLPTYPPPAATLNNSNNVNVNFDTFGDNSGVGMGMMYTPLQPSYGSGSNSNSGSGSNSNNNNNHGHQSRASYSGPYGTNNQSPFGNANNGGGGGAGGQSPRYTGGGGRRNQYGS
ncbi:uncharacterized protein I206_105887 [Kwoniella pini CBS 10737]|uniref:CMGC/DYRK/YAK protein kinase n=1 Tax=Kwoniella pini CBS 10737 TaxID=1296096 RepID=A0A1B9I0F9_9TREE|nr:CMGC/DYRK/YAK protein kinase [Kwoniella pini CBS 10737]OCF49020.1 CMGC/DYRK/YAK protein kinase [Kwoniella pini CBS 10737]